MNYVARNCKCSAWVVTALGSDGVLLACCGAFTCLVLCSCGMLLELYSTRGWKQWVPFFCECYTVCYLPLLISLQTGQPASVCNAIPSLQREEKKKSKLKPCCSRRPHCILRRLQSAIHCTLQPFVTYFYFSVKKRPRASCHSCICQATYVPVDKPLSSTGASYPTHKRSLVLYTWFISW